MKEIKKVEIKNIIRNIGFDKLLIIALCGVVLIILSIPSSDKGNKREVTDKSIKTGSEDSSISMSGEDYCEKLENRLEALLSKVDGISDVEVMITLKSTSESVVLTEVSYEKSNRKDTAGTGGVLSEENIYRNDSVVVYEKDSSGNTIPYVVKENVPQIEGIAVVARGGDEVQNILKITNALQALFNIDAHKISVIGRGGR